MVSGFHVSIYLQCYAVAHGGDGRGRTALNAQRFLSGAAAAAAAAYARGGESNTAHFIGAEMSIKMEQPT